MWNYIELKCFDNSIHINPCFSPGQPVVDLEAYMSSLEKKQQSLQKMLGVLSSKSDEAVLKRFFDRIGYCIIDLKILHQFKKINTATCPYYPAYLRLHDDLVPLDSQMNTSYGKLAEHLVELKMDHNDGKNQSPRLTALLVH